MSSVALIPRAADPARTLGRTHAQRSGVAVDVREVVNAILFLLRSGCAWRAIPHDPPNRHTCRHYYAASATTTPGT